MDGEPELEFCSEGKANGIDLGDTAEWFDQGEGDQHECYELLGDLNF